MGTSRKRFISARGIAVSFLILLLIIQLIFGAFAFVFAETKGTVNSDNGLNIRSGAGTDNPIVAVLPYRATVTILGEETSSDGITWYQISSNYGSGYVCAEYITVNQTPTPDDSDDDSDNDSGYDVSYSSEMDFEEYLSDQGFPESYKPYLRELHDAYPRWKFIAMHTGLDWEDVIYKETHPVSVSLVPNSWSDGWKSTERAAFDAETGEYIIFDSGGYVAASSAAVRYYMDPRNNMDSRSVFQFLSNKFDASTQTIDGIKTIVEETYLETRDPGDGYESYAHLLYDVGESVGVNPMTIASMLIVEQGRSGGSNLISGTCPGYEGYYNFFNIGAYAADGRSAVENGLIYAVRKGWDSPVKAITGGAEIFANNYVYNNKSTLYFKKFNVMNGLSKVGTGQYMTAVYAASTEGRVMADGYEDLTDNGISFEIPVYLNMPAAASPLPNYGDNINYLESLDVEEGNLAPAFDSYTTEYELTLQEGISIINITAAPVSDTATVSGVGAIEIPEGENISITCTSSTGQSRIYQISILRTKEDEKPEEKPEEKPQEKPVEKPVEPPAPTVSSGSYKVSDRVTGIPAGTSPGTFLENFKVTNGTAKLFDVNGNEFTSGIIGTNDCVKVYDSQGREKQSFTLIIKGDNNGDGKINSGDALRVMRHSIGTLTLTDAELAASDVNGDGKYNSADALLMQRYSIGTYKIDW